MKTQTLVLRLIAMLLFSWSTIFSGYSQLELLSLNMTKANELSPRTALNLAIPIAEGQTYFRLNLKESKFTKFQDDTGYDFLASGKGYLPEESYETFNSYNSRVDVYLSFEGTPAKGAREATLQGIFILEVEKQGSEEVTTRLKMPGNNSSMVTASEHGSIEVWNDGEASTDEATYIIYRIASALPVQAVSVVGGDDSEEANALGVGIEANQFVLKNAPEEIEVKLSLGNIEKLEIPLDLTFGIGF